jgi:hypothetical protein
MLLEAISSIVEGRSAVYVSSPLTTGSRAFEWHRRRSSSNGREQGPTFEVDVIEPNRDDAARFARALRAKTTKVVIDPTAMGDLDGWTQADYRVFWGRVIEEHCDEVVFRDGWQYSSGCTYEYLVGWETGSLLLQEDMTPLPRDEAQALIAMAVRETESHGASAAFLRAVASALARPKGYAWRE